VAAGSSFACGIEVGGVVHCWGSVSHYPPTSEPMAGGPTPTPVSTPERFVRVTVGTDHACGLTAEGQAFCWGDHFWGQLGDATSVVGRNIPAAVAGSHSFVTLEAGGNNTCGTTAAGVAYCWGADNNGQLGIGTEPRTGVFGEVQSRVPVRVENPRM
jgi:alpha-tubulin suppressor-like RCC1 family protein